MPQFDLHDFWLESALNERRDAQYWRKRGRSFSCVSSFWLAKQCYQRALFDLRMVRRLKKEASNQSTKAA